MAQYNYNAYRRPSPSRSYGRNSGSFYDVNRNADRIFVPTGSAPGPQEVENPYFQGDASAIEYEQPQGTQYFGSGVGEEAIDKLAYAYGQEAKLTAQETQAKAQLAADNARARANEGIMTGDINPMNPAASAVLDAMGVEVTAGMMGKSALEPDEVIKNIYGPRVAAGSMPSTMDDLVIQSRRRREAEARAKIDSFIGKNQSNLTEGDIAGFYQQHYASFPEFGPERQPPKTREEIFQEKQQAEEAAYQETWQPIATKFNLPKMPSRRDKDGNIQVDATAAQMMMNAATSERQVREGMGRAITSRVQNQIKALDAMLGSKPQNLRSPEGRAWLQKESEINKQKATVYENANKEAAQMKAFINPNEVNDAPEMSEVPADPTSAVDPNTGGTRKYTNRETFLEDVKAGRIGPNTPILMPNGTLQAFDENGKFYPVNR